MTESSRNNRDTWGGWISNKVATAEAALSTAFVEDAPTRSHSFHNLRAVAKANRLAALRRHPDHDEDEILPPLTRRASAIDLTLSHAWHAVRSAAVAAMATFEQPVEPTDALATQHPTIAEKAHFDVDTAISDVTISESACDASLDNPCLRMCEHARISTTSCNQHINTEHVVLKQVSDSTSSEQISPEQMKQVVDDFNTMFEQNGGADCVARVKQIGDRSLEAMREPESLNEGVEKELNDAKLKLDETLQRLECAVRSKVIDVAVNWDACSAAEGVIRETKENGDCGNPAKRNAILVQDCTRLLAVFASKICGCVLDRVEWDKNENTWNERVENIGCMSARGISGLRIIAKRFVEGVEGDNNSKKIEGRIYKVGDAAVKQVVECVALAVAALQVEVCERAYECCG